MQTGVTDPYAAKLVVSDTCAPEGADERLAPDVDTEADGSDFADVKVDGARRDFEFGDDRPLALAFEEADRDGLGG